MVYADPPEDEDDEEPFTTPFITPGGVFGIAEDADEHVPQPLNWEENRANRERIGSPEGMRSHGPGCSDCGDPTATNPITGEMVCINKDCPMHDPTMFVGQQRAYDEEGRQRSDKEVGEELGFDLEITNDKGQPAINRIQTLEQFPRALGNWKHKWASEDEAFEMAWGVVKSEEKGKFRGYTRDRIGGRSERQGKNRAWAQSRKNKRKRTRIKYNASKVRGSGSGARPKMRRQLGAGGERRQVTR